MINNNNNGVDWYVAEDKDFKWIEDSNGYDVDGSTGYFKFITEGKLNVRIPSVIHEKKLTSYYRMFAGYEGIQKIEAYDTKVTDMSEMFTMYKDTTATKNKKVSELDEVVEMIKDSSEIERRHMVNLIKKYKNRQEIDKIMETQWENTRRNRLDEFVSSLEKESDKTKDNLSLMEIGRMSEPKLRIELMIDRMNYIDNVETLFNMDEKYREIATIKELNESVISEQAGMVKIQKDIDKINNQLNNVIKTANGNKQGNIGLKLKKLSNIVDDLKLKTK